MAFLCSRFFIILLKEEFSMPQKSWNCVIFRSLINYVSDRWDMQILISDYKFLSVTCASLRILFLPKKGSFSPWRINPCTSQTLIDLSLALNWHDSIRYTVTLYCKRSFFTKKEDAPSFFRPPPPPYILLL